MIDIYRPEHDEINMNEKITEDIEDKFINAICGLICDALKINYNERRIIISLLYNVLKDKLNNNYPKDNTGLLQQYERYVLDNSSKKIIKEFQLDNVKVNHEHALHAKFNNIIVAIKKKLESNKIL